MKKIIPLFLVVCTFQALAQNRSYDYCYIKKEVAYVYAVADKKELMILKDGIDPCLSPDGKKVAYTVYADGGDRTIGIIDLNTMRKTVLNTGNNNCYGPAWSPDGKWIAFNTFDLEKSQWSIAIIDAANTTHKNLTGQLQQSYMPSWMSDNKSVVVQDMSSVFVFNLSGKITSTYKISKLAKSDGATSSDRFVFSSDGKKIAFTCQVDEPGFDEGPPGAVFVYDIATKTTIRLSPKGYYGNDVIIKDNRVLFWGGKIKSTVQNVYKVDLDGKNFKILFPGCWGISAKN